MIMTVNLDKYERLIQLAKGRGYGETAIKVHNTNFDEVMSWLTTEGYRATELAPITSQGYTGGAVKSEHRRILVEWRV